jgi:hypothetical protein
LNQVVALGERPLYLLALMSASGELMSLKRLRQLTGWGPNAVAAGLKRLSDLGLIRRTTTYRMWQCIGPAVQLYLGQGSQNSGAESEPMRRRLGDEDSSGGPSPWRRDEAQPASVAEAKPSVREVKASVAEGSDRPSSSSGSRDSKMRLDSSKTYKTPPPDGDEPDAAVDANLPAKPAEPSGAIQGTRGEPAKSSPPGGSHGPPDSPAGPSAEAGEHFKRVPAPPHMLAKIVALADAGIYDPVRTELANQPYVTPEYVRAHRLEARNVRLAIYRMRHAWPAPLNRFGHLLGCECEACSPPYSPAPDDACDRPDSCLHEPDQAPLDTGGLGGFVSADQASEPDAPDLPPGVEADWLSMLSSLKLEINRTMFERWVSGVRLASYDEPDNRYTALVRDEFARAWLDQHLRTSVARMLAAYSGRPASVQFVARTAPPPDGGGA